MPAEARLTRRRPAGASGGAATLPAHPRPPWVKDDLGGATGAGVRVAVIDSGWDRSRADARVLPGIHVRADAGGIDVGADDRDRLGHGTAATGQVLALAPGAVILPVRVFGDALETSPAALVAAIDRAVQEGARVVNLSLGTARKDALRPLYAACERARRAGAIVVAAGGNAGEACYPAVFEHVVGVAAAAFDSPFSFRYRPDEALEVEASGVRQPVPGLDGGVTLASGTSAAAPYVSAIVALLLERHPNATLDEVRALLARFAVG